MLMELKHVLQSQQTVNLLEITQRFGISIDLAHELLAVWQRKGCVAEVVDTCASGCQGCATSSIKQYRWLEK